MSFLPVTKKEMDERGWTQLDFLFISGDAYVDHPSFGHSIITRVLESEGFRVGIIPQPDWRNKSDFIVLGCPRLAVLISSGVLDSMVNHYTAWKKPRSNDAYSPGGKAGFRPDRALIVYTGIIKEVFKSVPVIIGGIEASLRRFAHYDYWSDSVRSSVLLDSKADMLVYGMGERPVVEIARELEKGLSIKDITGIRGTAFITNNLPSENSNKYITLPSFEEIKSNKGKYAEAFRMQSIQRDGSNEILVQKHSDRYLLQNPPSQPLDTSGMDRIYSLSYERTYHPMYEKNGGVPAINEVKFSITSHRGCIGGCSFCALSFHQGKSIQKRSSASIMKEAKNLVWLEGFKGYIHDVGGPTANFRNAACKIYKNMGECKKRSCLFPQICKNLIITHEEYFRLLRELRSLPGIRKVFIRSGIRFDYLLEEKSDKYIKELCTYHVSGQLKVAPEHVSDSVLSLMGKPSKQVYNLFEEKYNIANREAGLEQYLVPYFISSHPGSDIKSAVELAEYLRDKKLSPLQVQDFYPTPGTLSTTMYYTGLDPYSMKPIYIPKSGEEKKMQKALLQYRKKENRGIVIKALKIAQRTDLIGFGAKCIIRPEHKKQKTNERIET